MTTSNTPITIAENLLDRVVDAAHTLGISQAQLIEIAIEEFLAKHDLAADARVINQGDIYWMQTTDIPHPHLILQEDVLNHSRIETVVACALTSNMGRVSIPGNVLLDAGEGDLPRQSVVETAKVVTVYKAQLGAHIGSLSTDRVQQVLSAMRFVQASFFKR